MDSKGHTNPKRDEDVVIVVKGEMIDSIRATASLPRSHSPQAVIDEGLPQLLRLIPLQVSHYDTLNGDVMIFKGIHPDDWYIARAMIKLFEMKVGSSVEFSPLPVAERKDFRKRLNHILKQFDMKDLCIVFYLFRSAFVVKWADFDMATTVPLARLYDIKQNNKMRIRGIGIKGLDMEE